MTGTHTVAGVSTMRQIVVGRSAQVDLEVAAGDSFEGTVVVETSKNGGASWQTARSDVGTLLTYTGTEASPLTGTIVSAAKVTNESKKPILLRVRAADIAADGVSYSVDRGSTSDSAAGELQHATATFDPSTNGGHRAIGAHLLGIKIPNESIIVGGFVDVLTTFADGDADAATIALKVQGAGDIVLANDIADLSNLWDAGVHPTELDLSDPTTAIKLTAEREITATVAVAALTAGKLVVHLFYV